MKLSASRKSQPSISHREGTQFTQQISEIVRSILSRSEDTTILASLSDRASGKLKCASVFAEKLISDSELKEDWRIAKEDSVMISLNSLSAESATQKRYRIVSFLEKSSKKVLNAILKFAPEPSHRELNSSAMHVDNVMSTKVSPQSVLIEVDHTGRRIVTVLGSTPEGWRKQMWKEAKILEACLYGEVISVGLVLSTSLRFSRKLFEQEIANVRLSIENGECRQAALTSPVPQPSRKSQSMMLPMQLKVNSNSHRSVIRTSVASCDWKSKMVEMLLDSNKESQRAVLSFLSDYQARQASPKPAPSPIPKQSKSERAKLYESSGAVSPMADLCGEKWEGTREVPLIVLKDVHNAYFPPSDSLPARLHTLHSCLLIQRSFRQFLSWKSTNSALTIQTYFRMFAACTVLTQLRLLPFRRLIAVERIKHWLRLVAGRWRMAKDRTQVKGREAYLGEMPAILLVQKVVRGFVARRKEIPWRKFAMRMRGVHRQLQLRSVKMLQWRRCQPFEVEMLKNASAVCEQLQYFHHTLLQGKKIKGFKTERDVAGYVRNMEKAELRDRKAQMKAIGEMRGKILQS